MVGGRRDSSWVLLTSAAESRPALLNDSGGDDDSKDVSGVEVL